MSKYQLRAKSVVQPGTYLVEDSSGACFIYFADTGELSLTAVTHSFADAMMQCHEWAPINDGEWVTIAELQAMATTQVPPQSTVSDFAHPEF